MDTCLQFPLIILVVVTFVTAFRRFLGQQPDTVGSYATQIKLMVTQIGGRDVRIDGPYAGKTHDVLEYNVIFASRSGRYYRTMCQCRPDWKGTGKLYWQHDPRGMVLDYYKHLAYDVHSEEERQALRSESGQLRESNKGKEKLITLLHSSYRNERLWGIKLSAELGVTDGIVVERIRDLAYMDAVKEVRQAAADRLAQIEQR